MDFSVNIATREAIASEQEYVNILEREGQLQEQNAAAIASKSQGGGYGGGGLAGPSFETGQAADKIERGLIQKLTSSSSNFSHYLSRHTLHTITALMEGRLSPRVVSGAARLAGHAMEGAGGAIGAFGTSFLNTVGAVAPPAMAAAYAFSVIQGIKNEQIKEQEERYKNDLKTYSSLWEEQNNLANKHNETQRERVLDKTKEFLTGRAASQNWADENIGWRTDLGGFETYRQRMDVNKLKEADFRERMKMLGYAENDARVRAGTFWFNQGKTTKDRTAWNWMLEHSGVYSNYAQTQRDIATAELSEEHQEKILKFEETREQRRMANDPHYRITTHNQENLLKEVEKSLALEFSDWNKY